MPDLIINFAPTGMIPTKKLTPYVPITIDEIINEVIEAIDIGITMVHLHARDINEAPTYDSKVYAAIIEGIRNYNQEIVICVSLSGRDFKEFEKRSNPLTLKGDLKPDMGSLTLSSMNFLQQASVNSPEMVQDLAKYMRDNGIVPENEAFDVGMINYMKYLIKKGIINLPYYINLFVGNIATAQLNLVHIGAMISDLPANGYWSLAGIGESQRPANIIGLIMGGGIRIGLEDSMTMNGCLIKNRDLLCVTHDTAKLANKKMMSSKVFRQLINMKTGTGGFGR